MGIDGAKRNQQQIKNRIKEVYNGTAFKIKINERLSKELYTKKGVRQGCPLSTVPV